MNKNGIVLDRDEPSRVFLEARTMAGNSISAIFREKSEGGKPSAYGFRWLKPELTCPAFEHFTFAYKNQVFPVFVELIINGKSQMTQKESDRLLDAAKEFNLVPCLYKVEVIPEYQCTSKGNKIAGLFGWGWYVNKTPDLQKPPKKMTPLPKGWNLFDLRTGEPVNPEKLGTDTPIKMSAWELSNFSCQIVRNHISEIGGTVLSFCDLPGVNPQIWFKDKDGRRGWIVVRHIVNIEDDDYHKWVGLEKRNPSLKPYDGFFAGVSFASSEPILRDENGEIIPLSNRFASDTPLYRGDNMYVRFGGLQRIYVS